MLVTENKVRIWHPDKVVILTNLENIGKETTIHAFCWIGRDVVIGQKCFIEAFVFIPEWVTIGDNVFIGPHVCFTNDKRPPSFGEHWAKTIVEDNVSIGAGAVILPGVTLKKGCVIGAGAVVTKDVEAGVTVVGNPARLYEKL